MIELYAHQKNALKFLEGKKFAALLMDMGTGKSLTILTHILNNGITPTLIITKNSIKYNWAVELDKIGVARELVSILDGATPKKKAALADMTKQFYILNYESVRLLKDEIRARGFKSIVLDESTAIKNPTAKVSKAILSLSRYIENRFILTGTPVTNAPLDAYNQFAFLDSSILFFYSYFAFRNYYAVMVERRINGRSFKDIVAYKNLDELVARVQPHSFMIKKSECLDLPDKVYETREIEMTPEQDKIYTTLAKELVSEINSTETCVVSNILTKLLRLQQILGGNAVAESGVNVPIKENKTAELLDVMSEIGDAKVVIWARFVAEIRKLEAVLNGAGYKTKSIHGEVKNDERQKIVDEINNGDLRCVVCQQQTAGFGLNITGANVAIYFSNDWSLQNRQQSEDRIHRIGQTKSVTIVDIVHKHTLEENIIAALKTKKTFQDIFFMKHDGAETGVAFKDKIVKMLDGKEVEK